VAAGPNLAEFRHSIGDSRVEERPTPEPGPGDVLVAMRTVDITSRSHLDPLSGAEWGRGEAATRGSRAAEGPQPALSAAKGSSNPRDPMIGRRGEAAQPRRSHGRAEGISGQLGGSFEYFAAGALPGGSPDHRSFQTMPAASRTIQADIFDLPTRRSTKRIGTSTMRRPRRWQR
jgi:hypothetical protein